MPHYTKYGKIETPMTDEDFAKGMTTGAFEKRKHKGYCVLVYYTGIRKTEGLRVTKEQFRITENSVICSVGIRLKHGIETANLPLPRSAPYMDELIYAIEHTKPNQRVFPYSPKTAYNIIARVYKYPHHFRLSRITNFFAQGWSIAQVRSWTGLTIQGLEFYIGLVDIQKMGESLAHNEGIYQRQIP